MQLFFSQKYLLLIFFPDSPVAKLTHLNMENCEIHDLNFNRSNNIFGSYHLSYTEKAS
jgi:hypothetical protein